MATWLIKLPRLTGASDYWTIVLATGVMGFSYPPIGLMALAAWSAVAVVDGHDKQVRAGKCAAW